MGLSAKNMNARLHFLRERNGCRFNFLETEIPFLFVMEWMACASHKVLRQNRIANNLQ